MLSNLRKEKKHPAVLSWVENTGWQELSTTVITIAEIQCGIYRQMPKHPAYAKNTQKWLNAPVDVSGPKIWPLGTRAALLLARMHETAALRNFVAADPKQKKPRTAGDLAIAAKTCLPGLKPSPTCGVAAARVAVGSKDVCRSASS